MDTGSRSLPALRGLIWADPSTLTAGTVGSAVPGNPRRDNGGPFDARLFGRHFGAARFRHYAGRAGWYWAERLGIRVHTSLVVVLLGLAAFNYCVRKVLPVIAHRPS